MGAGPVKEKIKIKLGNATCLGLVGMGGIGKTMHLDESNHSNVYIDKIALCFEGIVDLRQAEHWIELSNNPHSQSLESFEPLSNARYVISAINV